MNPLINYVKQGCYEKALGVDFLATPREIDAKKIALILEYRSDKETQMAINCAASALKAEYQDTSRKSFVERLRSAGHLLFNAEQLQDALVYFNRVIREAPTEHDYVAKLAILIKLDRRHEAFNLGTEIVRKYPNSLLAEIYQKLYGHLIPSDLVSSNESFTQLPEKKSAPNAEPHKMGFWEWLLKILKFLFNL